MKAIDDGRVIVGSGEIIVAAKHRAVEGVAFIMIAQGKQRRHVESRLGKDAFQLLVGADVYIRIAAAKNSNAKSHALAAEAEISLAKDGLHINPAWC